MCLTPRISRARRIYALRLAEDGKVDLNKTLALWRRLHALDGHWILFLDFWLYLSIR
jgi:hypothetical protein